MDTQKKRRWDSTIATGTSTRDTGDETDISNNLAIKNALEVAKKISAKIETSKDTCDDTTTTVISTDTSTDTSIVTSTDTSTVPSNSHSSSSFPFEKDSKNSSLFLDPSFPQLIHSRLQLGPSEHFKVTISDYNLYLEASSQDVIDLAVKECKSIQETGQFISISKLKLQNEKIFLGFDASIPSAHSSFLRGKLLGPQGSFLKHIYSVTRCRVQLRGKGSGYIEIVKGSEVEPLHLVIEPGSSENDLKEARQLCEDLIATAKAEYEAKFIKPATPTQQYPYNAQSYAQAQAQYYQQYQHALAQYYAQFTHNKQP